MSFVGLSICWNGVVGFADRKTSRTDILGNLHEDKKRGPITKLFQTNHYMIATFGANELLTPSGKICFLEDWIEKELPNHPDYESLFLAFARERPIAPEAQYSFFVGTEDKNGYFVQLIRIQDQTCTFSKRFRDCKVYAGGVDWYIKQEQMLTDLLIQNNDIQTYSKRIKEQLEWMVQRAETQTDGYNPVGQTFDILTLV